MDIVIRPIRLADAANFLLLCCALDAETKYMMLEPGERTTTVTEQEQMIRGMESSGHHRIFVAEAEGQLVGYIGGRGGMYRRNRHSMYIAVGILKAYQNKGVGKRLFQALEVWARQEGIHRLELTVMVHNEAGIALYKKMGFQEKGRHRHTMRVAGVYVDELAMAKILEDSF